MNEKTYKVEGEEIKTSNLDKIFYPELKINKKKVIEYYHRIAPFMLPHLDGRPLNLHRAPDGIGGETFYQQDAPDYFPSWIDRFEVAKADGSKINHPLCSSRPALIYLANQAVLSFHIWLSRQGHIENPDKMIFDLDPPSGSSFHLVQEGALLIKDFFSSLSISCWVMTTGSKGLHLIIPLNESHDFDQVRKTARIIAEKLIHRFPRRFTIKTYKKNRKGRIYLDYARNSWGQTTICPYSLRILPYAPIATPLDWEELKKPEINPQTYNIGNIFRRMGQKEDPWHNLYSQKEDLKEIKEKIDSL